MSIWVGENAKVLIQGITGNQGRFHGAKMVEYGTEIVGGVTPRKGGSTVTLHNLDLPVYDTMNEAIIATDAEVSVIYVPPPLLRPSPRSPRSSLWPPFQDPSQTPPSSL